MGTTVLLLVSMSGQLRGQQPEEKPGNWFTRLWKKAPAPKDRDEKKDTVATTPSMPTTSVTTRVLSDRLMRRSEVVLRLHEIAAQRNDEKLRRMAEQLDQRLTESAQASTPYRGGFRSDEQILEDRLGGASSGGLTQPTASGRVPTPGGTIAGRREAP
jgi:hypothetical protein